MYKGKKRHVLLSFFLVFLMGFTTMFHGQQFVFANDNVPEDERFNVTEHKEMTLGITRAGYEQEGVFIALPRSQAIYDAREHNPASLTALTLDLSFQIKREVLTQEMQIWVFSKCNYQMV